jgi:uncharacterized protein (TIGR03089 family)
MDPVAALQAETRTEPSRPLLTWYGSGTERTELSVITYANGVAKTASFMRDELLLEPGDRVEVNLGLHWQTSVWIGACAANGVRLFLGSTSAGSEPGSTVVSFDPESIADSPAENKVVVSRHPLGLPGPPLAEPFIDHARAAMAQPDTIDTDPADSSNFRLVADRSEGEFDLNRIAEATHSAGRELGIEPGATVLSTVPPAATNGWLAAWAIPLLNHSHTIWCVPEADSRTIARAELASITLH